MKDKVYIIKLFGSSTSKGKELIESISSTIPKYVEAMLIDFGHNDVTCRLDILTPNDMEYNTLFFYKYQKTSDILIFDGSIEEEFGCLLGDNYQCVPHAPYMNSNVIVVSRTVLPLNFIPHTTNVLPFGENFEVSNDNVMPVTSYDNGDIIEFIKETIATIIYRQFNETSLKKESDSSVKKDPQLFLSNGEKVAFISYRSFYKENLCGEYNVDKLKQHIEDFHKLKNPNEKWKVIFYPPGGLSQDCPTEYLRWALMTYVQNVFVHIDEVWIFDTENIDEKSYWDSWYTQGEFLSLMMIQQGLPEFMPIVYLFDPHTGKSKKLEKLPSIASQEYSELSLLSANSDILWGDYAALRNVIMFIREWKQYGCIKKSLWSLFAKSISFVAKIFWKDLSITDFDSLSKKHAYQPGFLTNRIFCCPDCKITGYTQDSFQDKNFIRQFISIGDRQNPVQGYFTLSGIEFTEAVKKGYVECPSCHNRIYIKKNPSQDFYLWKKHTRNTNPESDWYIEKIPAFSITQR